MGALVTSAALAVVASAGWGCVAMATLELTPSAVEPGQRVEFVGSYYHDGGPVILRWDSVDGHILATVPPEELVDFRHSHWRTIGGGFIIPTDAPPGSHVVMATQEASDGKPTWGVPARAVVVVGGGTPAEAEKPALPPVKRLAELDIKSAGGPDVVPVVALGLASALIAGVAAQRVRRRTTRRHGPDRT